LTSALSWSCKLHVLSDESEAYVVKLPLDQAGQR
jgi:hypothetical protein